MISLEIVQSLSWIQIMLVMVALPLAKAMLTVVYEICKLLMPPVDTLTRYCRKDVDSWAVVTGATDGVGLGFVQVLVDKGFNVVLISRNPQKLRTTVDNLQKKKLAGKKGGKLKTIAFDFKETTNYSKYQVVLDQLKELDIAILVNNVGMSQPNIIHKTDYQLIIDTITVNCTSMAVLSANLLQTMSKRTHQSAIINLSSFINQRPLPYFSLYAGSKGFNRNLTQSMSLQYPHIDILALKPYFVQSPSSRQKRGFMVPNRKQCAIYSLQELRWEHESYGYISHRILGALMSNLMPSWLSRIAVGLFTKSMLKKQVPEARLD